MDNHKLYFGVAQTVHIIMNTFCHNILKSKMTRREKETR